MMGRYLLGISIGLLLMLGAQGALAQGRPSDEISGVVRDASGAPVADAIITVRETPDVLTISDADGTFTIRAEIGQHLVVTKGRTTGETVRIDQAHLSIVLDDSRSEIPLGYGQARRPKEVTAAVGVVRADKLSKSGTVINPANALYGRIPGLMVLGSGGGPPIWPTMRIRGSGTFTNNTPLVLVDGFERPLHALSVEEIASVTVLKDAAALAKYGVRGANGAILVTTRRGRPGPLRVHVSMEASMMRPVTLPDMVGAATYARALNEALANDGDPLRYSPAEIDAFASGTSPYFYPNVNWFDRVLRDYGTRSRLEVTFGGGGETARYFALLNYVHDSGIFGPTGRNEGYSTQNLFEKLNFRSNIDVNITDDLLFQVNVAGILKDENLPDGGGGESRIMQALYSIPAGAFPVRTPSGHWGGTNIYGDNPVAVLTSTGFGSPNSREFFVDGHLTYDLDAVADGLSAEVTIGYSNFGSYFQQKDRDFLYEEIGLIRDAAGNVVDTTAIQYGQNTDLDFEHSFGNQRIQSDVVGKINYDRSFGKHELNATVLFHQQARTLDQRDNTFHRRNFVASLHYGWAGKYFVGATTSYSGTNILAEGNKYTFFPAVSAAWVLSEENFLEEVSFLDRLKLRASWGTTGSDRLPTNSVYKHGYYYAGYLSYRFQDQNTPRPGFAESRLAMPHFTVETSYKTNVGIDARLFGGLELTAYAFYARRTSILTASNADVSNVLGIAPPLLTTGVVENKGFEGALSWHDTIGGVAYHIGGQFTFACNTIVEMAEQFRPYPYLKRTGRSVGQRFGLEVIGFFKNEQDIANSPRQVFAEDVQPGDLKYKDQNGDGIINEYDEVPIGYSSDYPEMYFSAALGFEYEGFAVSALFQGTGHYTAYLNTQSVFWPLKNHNTISSYYYTHRWTPKTAKTATFPRLTTESANNFRPNSLWLVDRSYVKLRMLQVSYTLPVSITRPLHLSQLQVVARGMNLFSIDHLPVMAPEYLSGTYPRLRSYTIGLNFTF